jgi:hypothetical protein
MSDNPPTLNDLERKQWELLNAQIASLEQQREYHRKQIQWEPWKALAAMAGGCALLVAAATAFAHWGQPAWQRTWLEQDRPFYVAPPPAPGGRG